MKNPYIQLQSINLHFPLEGFDNRLLSFQNFKNLIRVKNTNTKQNVGGHITLIKTIC